MDMVEGFREVGRGGGFFPMGGGGPFRKLPGPIGGGPGAPRPGTEGADADGGFGTGKVGGLGADGAASAVFDESAPVSMPPRVFFRVGIPPANKPPSCGAASIPAPEACSLSLRARLPGTGGAPPGGFGAPPMTGIGGAPPTGGPDDEDDLPTTGADRSFVTAFFSALPLWISDRSAPWGKAS